MSVKEQFNNYYFHFNNTEWKDVDGVDYSIEYEENTKEVYILFQDSREKSDWLSNLLFFPKKVTPYKDMEYPYKVHRGFWGQFDKVRDSILEEVKLLVTNKTVEVINIYGWSLGGILATYCKEMLEYHKVHNTIYCMTIGSPRGYCKTKHWNDIKSRFTNTVRFTNGQDWVTKLPFKWMGLFTPFTHIIEDIHVGEKFNIFKVYKSGKDHQQERYKENIIKKEIL